MKPSSPRRPSRPLSRSAARNFALLNQLATPGLGSLLAGRRLAGAGQLFLAVAGFGLVLAWFVAVLLQVYNDIEGQPQTKSMAWLGETGAITFAAAWVWALFTSLSLLRETRDNGNESNLPPHLPPA
jgi:hypothetical protein